MNETTSADAHIIDVHDTEAAARFVSAVNEDFHGGIAELLLVARWVESGRPLPDSYRMIR